MRAVYSVSRRRLVSSLSKARQSRSRTYRTWLPRAAGRPCPGYAGRCAPACREDRPSAVTRRRRREIRTCLCSIRASPPSCQQLYGSTARTVRKAPPSQFTRRRRANRRKRCTRRSARQSKVCAFPHSMASSGRDASLPCRPAEPDDPLLDSKKVFSESITGDTMSLLRLPCCCCRDYARNACEIGLSPGLPHRSERKSYCRHRRHLLAGSGMVRAAVGRKLLFMAEAQQTRGSWAVAGPDAAPAWTQGGESEFMSIAARADEPDEVASRTR